ncbi:MAG: high affinity choline transporter 1 [Planctomycetota bacterium]|jgi:Na+/proline symporter
MELIAAEQIALSPDAVQLLGMALCGYVVFLLAVSVFATSKVKDEADYLIAGRRLPLFLAWGTLIATWFGAATMFGAAEASREEGILGVVLDPLACAATLVFAGLFFAKPLWEMNIFTMADFYRQKYGPKAEITGACIQVPGYFAWIALQYTALARLLEGYFGIDLTMAILLVAGVTLVYTMIGGMWSVTLTDTLQILVAIVGLMVLTVTVFAQPELGDGNVIRGITSLPDKVRSSFPNHFDLIPRDGGLPVMLGFIGAWATGLLGNIPGQDLQQRVFAARDSKTATRACVLAGVMYFAFGMLPVMLGIVSRVIEPEADIDPVVYLAGRYLSTGMLVVFVIAVVSMIVSTATSAVLAPATILGHNLLNHMPGFADRALLRDRLSVLLVSCGGIGIAMLGETLMGLLDLALSVQLVALFVPVAMGIYGKPRGQLSAVLAMTLGFTAWFVRYLAESVLFAIPDETAETYATYSDFVAAEFPIEALRSVVSTWAYIPEDFYGFGASLFGYFLGQWILSRRGR